MAIPLNQPHYLRLLEEEEDIEVVALVLLRNRLENQRARRRFWVKPWLQRKPRLGQYETLFQELDRESEGDYMGFMRMDRNLFAEVLQRVEPRIVRSERYAPFCILVTYFRIRYTLCRKFKRLLIIFEFTISTKSICFFCIAGAGVL